MEVSSSSERVATVRRDDDWDSARGGIEMDGERNNQRVCEGIS